MGFGYNRLYSSYKLVTWSQRRCIKCQRFLSKKQQKYCKPCSDKVKLEYNKDRYQNIAINNPHYSRDRNRIARALKKKVL